MSLQEAVIAIADEMDSMATTVDKDVKMILTLFSKQLRIAVKASGSGQQNQAAPFYLDNLSAQAQHYSMVEKAKEEFRKKGDNQKAISDFQERVEPRMVYAIDGPLAGVEVPCDPRMPINAHTEIGGNVYTLKEDGCLHSNSVD